jgi:hypothetical protein
LVLFLRGEPGYHVVIMKARSRAQILYDLPGTYHICVQGAIDPTWSDRLEGMELHLSAVGGEARVTTLEGELSDQAALAGVLNSLYELHLPILMVMRLSVEPFKSSDDEEPSVEKRQKTIP